MLTPALLYHTVTLCPLSAPHPTHLPHSPVPSWAVPYVSATESKQCPQEWHTEALGAACYQHLHGSSTEQKQSPAM